MSFSNDSKQKLIAIAAAIIVALLGINAFLLYNKYNQAKIIEQKTQELDEAEKLTTELEKQYYEALAELEEMRGNNEELNALIDEQKAGLKEQKEKIAQLIRTGKSNKGELSKARSQINDLKDQVQQYVAEITQLKEENQLLTDANASLTDERNNLQMSVAEERQMNEELTSARAALVSEKEGLLQEKDALSKKVNVASVVKVKSVNVTGEKLRKNGKPIKKKYAKSIDRIKVCFTTTDNDVTDSGVEQFYIRILNPVGETIAVEDLGSGVMMNRATNEELRYTQMKELDYNNDEMQACFLWEPNTTFKKGEYEVEVYNKGHLAGNGKFTLK